jgi:hypothetical protein
MIDFENTKQHFSDEEWFDQRQLSFRTYDLMLVFFLNSFLVEKGSAFFLLTYIYLGYIISKYDQDLIKETGDFFNFKKFAM